MSVEVMSAVFKRYPNGGGEMLLALALADHAHDDGTKIFPFVQHLAEKTRQSVRSVQYQLRRMEESGWLILVNAGNGGYGRPNEYRISPDWLKGAEIAPMKRVQSETEKGANDNAKGAIDDKKGCNGLHPHITVKEPSTTINEPSAPARDGLPDWLPTSSWEMWDRFRKKKSGKAWTDDAKHLSICKLGKLRAQGHDPTAVIEQSVQAGWTGLFPLKADTTAPPRGKFDPVAYMNQENKPRKADGYDPDDIIDV